MKTHPDANDTLRGEGVEGVRRRQDGARKFARNGFNDGNNNGRFPLVPFKDLVPSTAPRYLIKRLIPRTGIVLIWGPSKCGKSFLAFTINMHVALNKSYQERRVK